MQKNEFERQVQQKMDDLEIHPSDAVWQKIEPQIKKERRRRWLLILLPVLLIGFLYGGYVLLDTDRPDTELQQELTKKSIEKNNSTNEPKATFDSIKNNYPVKATGELIIAKTKNVKPRRNQNIKIPARSLNSDHNITPNFKQDIPVKPGRKESIVLNEKTNMNIENPAQEKIVDKESDPVSTITQAEELQKQDEVLAAKDSAETKNEKVSKEENLIKRETKKTSKSKSSWNWGFTFSGGVSGMANNFLEYGQQRFDAALFSSGQVIVNPRPGPSSIKPSVAFITGVFTEKNVSKKIILTTGITYKLFSATNRVGSDSSGFFGTSDVNNANTYHSFYHYIELPVGFKVQIADFKKARLYWNAGLSVSQLIGAKALQYNSSGGLYYHDNSFFNKTQTGFNTGLDIAFLSKNKRSFLIGPYLNYGISKIASQGYNSHHFTYIGLRAQYLFRKK